MFDLCLAWIRTQGLEQNKAPFVEWHFCYTMKLLVAILLLHFGTSYMNVNVNVNLYSASSQKAPLMRSNEIAIVFNASVYLAVCLSHSVCVCQQTKKLLSCSGRPYMSFGFSGSPPPFSVYKIWRIDHGYEYFVVTLLVGSHDPKNRLQLTYNVSSGTLNPTMPYFGTYVRL